MKKLIIFDCDGVLVDSEKLANQAFVDCLADCGFSMSLNEAIRRFKGQKFAACLAVVEEISGSKLPEEFETKFRDRMASSFETSLKPIPGIEEAIKALDGYAICVASNGPIEKIQKSLSITGLGKYFGNNLYSAYTIQKWKPEPDLFLYASSELNIKHDNCLVIEDSTPGIIAAQRANMKVLGFSGQDNDEELCSTGAEVFGNMSDLPDIVSRML